MIGIYNLVVFPEQEDDVTDEQGAEIIANGHGYLSPVQPVQGEEQTKAEEIAKPKKVSKK